MLLGKLGASLLGKMLADKDVIRAGDRVRKYFDLFWNAKEFDLNESKVIGIYSQNSLPKPMKDRDYVIRLDEYKPIETL